MTAKNRECQVSDFGSQNCRRLNVDLLMASERLRATLDFNGSLASPRILFLHGAGTGNRQRAEYLAHSLAGRGASCLRFDFSGHGDSTGALLGSTLAGRLHEAKTAASLLDRSGPITLIGNSMGGYLAARLTRLIPVAHLVLLCPAAYAQEADAVPFGSDFTAILRKAGSYTNSLSFGDVADFEGRVTVVTGTQDEVIPEQVIASYMKAAAIRPGRSHELIRLDGAGHMLHPWLQCHLLDHERLLSVFD